MKRYNILIIVLLSISVLIAGCDSADTTVSTDGAFIGGTQGIAAAFEPFGVEDDGVLTVFDTETFPLEVTVRNRGEYEVQPSDITVSLLGPLLSDFTGIASGSKSNADVIDKVAELTPDGGEETISFATDAAYTPTVTGFRDIDWFANVEYNYETTVIIPEVCLKEDLTDDRVCEPKETKTYFVSGAPITAKAVEQSTAGKGIMALKIQISNEGSGKVTKQGTPFSSTKNTLTFSLNDADWECKSGGKVNEARLADGSAEIICKLKNPLPADTLATKELTLTLQYTYRDTVGETLRIKESLS